MKIKEITQYLNQLAPLAYAESFDNVGLLVGDKDTTVTGILVTLDTLEQTIDEAIQQQCNLIVSFHPIIFSGLKKLNGQNYVERVVIKAIQNNIAIYAIHTALDNFIKGVNAKICEQLQLKNTQILIPQKNTLHKIATYVPKDHASALRNSLFKAGAGSIGNYSECSFNTNGFGTYKANEFANPTIGEKGMRHTEEETYISVIFEKHQQATILQSLFKNHPYEEVAYEITVLENTNQQIGIGMIGELETEMDETTFFKHVQKQMQTTCIRHSTFLNKKIKKIAVLGGSGSFGIKPAIQQHADVFITADLKYHDFYLAENKLVLMDIGHYESEQYTKNLIVELLREKFCNFAIILSERSTNPIYYYQ